MEVGQRGVAVRPLGGNRAGEIRLTRLLRNPKVRIEEMIGHARTQTFSLVGGLHVLAIHDTINLRDDGSGQSFNLYPTIALKPDTVELLIRASYGRALKLENERGERLFSHVAGQAEAG